ncbi:MAG: hypothetical protein M0D57_10070 [Sphingobacteriales bacterium JAD_PAG50586_3]|nr:MAG: hypothetical protein M0D57_10070 [Sphingobacteriales bacterium JAD_PAG50586_3]
MLLEIVNVLLFMWLLTGIGLMGYYIINRKKQHSFKYLPWGILLALPAIIKLVFFVNYSSPNMDGYKEILLWFTALLIIAFPIIVILAVVLSIIAIPAYFIMKKNKLKREKEYNTFIKNLNGHK